jgi:hypothetical protein
MSDQNAGMGGSYLLDPVTGERKLIERTTEPLFTEPADAGFLTPVDPVTPADTITPKE